MAFTTGQLVVGIVYNPLYSYNPIKINYVEYTDYCEVLILARNYKVLVNRHTKVVGEGKVCCFQKCLYKVLR